MKLYKRHREWLQYNKYVNIIGMQITANVTPLLTNEKTEEV